MKITLNGSVVETDQTDLLALVHERGVDPSSLVIEHNLSVIKQDNWPLTPLREGDTIELLNFVGGG
ncbi:MAG: sulfur carrier protein ThiS [Desulfobacter sp.]|nr:MAG: sulfur carrier protein ThiS [Desulfobacter sp.]